MTIVKLIERMRAATMGFDWADLPDDACVPAVPLLREAAQALASSQEEIERLTRERDEALRLADWSAVENNTIVNQVWELLGGPDATREGGQSLIARVEERLADLERLRKALEPFAEAARKAGYYPHSHLLATREVTIQDFRAAACALASKAGAA